MSKRKKICYALFKKGNLVAESAHLPIYWNREVAKRRADDLDVDLHKLDLDELQREIFYKSKKMKR